jgi:hypothetical protein
VTGVTGRLDRMVEVLAERVEERAPKSRRGLVSRRGPGIRLFLGLFLVVGPRCRSRWSVLSSQAVDLDDGAILHGNAARREAALGAILQPLVSMSPSLR